MGVSTRYVLHQGPVLGALGRAAMAAVKSRKKTSGGSAPTQIPGRELRERIPPRPADLVQDYIRNVGGDPSAYRNQVPAHLFPHCPRSGADPRRSLFGSAARRTGVCLPTWTRTVRLSRA